MMKIRLFTLTLLSALALSLGVVRAADEDHTPLGEKMEKIGGAWRVVKRQINDPAKNQETLTKLATIKENLTAALDLEPALKAEKPAAEQPKFMADYQAKIKEEITKIDQIAAALKAGKNEEAAKLVGIVDQDQKDAHKKFKKQKKKQS